MNISNNVHITRAAIAHGNYVCASLIRGFVRQDGVVVSIVSLTLYGPDWSDKDVERAERQTRVVNGTDAQRLAVRNSLLDSCSSWLSLPLRDVSEVGLSCEGHRARG